jgi:FlaA1/EpsC-like NDP-sugar epimerase
MGVSKRLAELAVLTLSNAAQRMNAIRLVNVIGSPGSVAPIFKKQIAARELLTVTHPKATRWFLSLNQTVAAILASGMAEVEGRVLVPAVGPQTRIVDLARSLIGAAELPIVFTGCRSGDKITEELTFETECKEGTVGGSLQVIGTRRLQIGEIDEIMKQLGDSIAARDVPELVRTLRAVVPEYVPSELLL